MRVLTASMSEPSIASSEGAMWRIAAIMLSTVSPVIECADAASPQPTWPPASSTRTSTLSAALISTPAIFIGFAIGESLGASALRICGGIFTKIADIGADLMKIVFNLPEDDPRNPGVIADCTGDNAGDSVGPTADGFETYGVTGVALITFIMLAVQQPVVQVKLLVWIFVMRTVMVLVSGAQLAELELRDEHSQELVLRHGIPDRVRNRAQILAHDQALCPVALESDLAQQVVEAGLPFALVLGAALLDVGQAFLCLAVGVLGVGLLDHGALEFGLRLLPARPAMPRLLE